MSPDARRLTGEHSMHSDNPENDEKAKREEAASEKHTRRQSQNPGEQNVAKGRFLQARAIGGHCPGDSG